MLETANIKLTKPFLKWAGGKSQLLSQIDPHIQRAFENNSINKYVEPFVGGGAVFFHVVQNYSFDECYLIDINPELIVSYITIKSDVLRLISRLKAIEKKYHSLSIEKQSEYFYKTREKFNELRSAFDFENYNSDWIGRTAQFIFLNRTCFNGLFRVNSKGGFNVPFGKYKKPTICATDNLKSVSAILQDVEIKQGDFTDSDEFIDDRTLVYFDPPYRPISRTASFTSYARNSFDDSDQLKLAAYFRSLNKKGASLLLSNSDPKNENPDDEFFDDAYRGFNIQRVSASRAINCNAEKRGQITEILVTNY